MDGRAMMNPNFSELHDTIRAMVGGAGSDALSKCLRDQMEIVLRSLEGWDALTGLLAGEA